MKKSPEKYFKVCGVNLDLNLDAVSSVPPAKCRVHAGPEEGQERLQGL